MKRSNLLKSALKSSYDAIVIGGGHNGLVASAYLAKAGKSVACLEKRHVLGGAAVTEEIVPGYKFSRASYVVSLLRPKVINELELKKHGLKVHLRNPNSFTPLIDGSNSLTLGNGKENTFNEIAKFSKKDAENYFKFDEKLEHYSQAIEPLLDSRPPDMNNSFWSERNEINNLYKMGKKLGLKEIPEFYRLLTAPISTILNEWFESEPLKATLGTDGVIGAWISPYSAGSGYVLLHHVMGGIDGLPGAWGYAEGGMGAVSSAIASSARASGAEIFTEQEIDSLIINGSGQAQGVALKDGREIKAKIVLSNATPEVTFNKLIKGSDKERFIDERTQASIDSIDYKSPVTKINVAVDKIPNFLAKPNLKGKERECMPHHQCTIHLNCENLDLVHEGYLQAETKGFYSDTPMIEMSIASSLDKTLTPGDKNNEGHHCISLFTQYTPIKLKDPKTGELKKWTKQDKQNYTDKIFNVVESYAPGFKNSVIGYDTLTPQDLEDTIGLTGGNIFHGSMGLDQLFLARPTGKFTGCVTPIEGLYLAGSGAHPGGGVMGSCGRLAAEYALRKF